MFFLFFRAIDGQCSISSPPSPGCSWVPSRLSPGTASVPLRLHYHPYRNRRSLGEGDSQSYAAAKTLAQIPEAFADGRSLMLTPKLQHRRMAKILAKAIRDRMKPVHFSFFVPFCPIPEACVMTHLLINVITKVF